MTRYQPKNFPLTDYRFAGDQAGGIPPYLFPEKALIAIDVALASERPLLVAGPPGCGKSRLAQAMAAVLGWNFLCKTMTSRTRLEQLTVDIDQLRRLHDAHCAAVPRARATNPSSRPAAALKPDAAYYNPGIFWWAFDCESASRRGVTKKKLPSDVTDLVFPGTRRIPPEEHQHTVLLIDEIDKAEPDLPNDLLEPLDRRSFDLPHGTALTAAADQKLFTVITTNRERELPRAFLRRCVTIILDEPDADGLTEIAEAHQPQADRRRIRAIAERVVACRLEATEQDLRAPGTSEFLDAVRVCEELKIDVDGRLWEQIKGAVLLKPKV
ncbi:MAG: MoxR family ATPase [Candidatus Accumulibacter sp. UW26]|jgi:MoxR-like ATPase